MEPIPKPKFPRKDNKHKNRGYIITEMDELSARDLEAMFRMGRNGCNLFLTRIESRMNHSDSDQSVVRAISSSGSPISKGSIWRPVQALVDVIKNEYLRNYLSLFIGNYGDDLHSWKSLIQIGTKTYGQCPRNSSISSSSSSRAY